MEFRGGRAGGGSSGGSGGVGGRWSGEVGGPCWGWGWSRWRSGWCSRRRTGRGWTPSRPGTITGPTRSNWDVAADDRQRPGLPDGPHRRGPDQQRRYVLRRDPFGSLTIRGTGYTIASTQSYGVALSGTIEASQTSGLSTLNLPVDFGTTAGTVKVDNSAATLAMGGVITGSAGLTTQGSGVLDLTGTNTYTGGTTVSAGTLLVDGAVAGTVAVSSGATLGGIGTVGSIGTTAGTVSPGDSTTATGVLTDPAP